MNDLNQYRRTLRLTISIPIVISGVNADGNGFSESAHTQVVNKHGGKIAMTHYLDAGAEVLVENRAIAAMAKARVVRLGEKDHARDLYIVAIELLEMANVWGITFPPIDGNTVASG